MINSTKFNSKAHIETIFRPKLKFKDMMFCAIWYDLYNLKNIKNTHGGVLSLQLTKSNTPPWVFFTLFKLNKCYQIVQHTIDILFAGSHLDPSQCICTIKNENLT